MTTCKSVVSDCQTVADTITLDSTARHRRRVRMVSDGGITFMLDLPEARLLREGEGLVLEDGQIIAVRAAAEELYEVRAQSPQHLLQLAWQIGNRHLSVSIQQDHLLIRRDPVIRTMLEGLGAMVKDVERGFDPEPGAYGHHHASHDHHGDHAHG